MSREIPATRSRIAGPVTRVAVPSRVKSRPGNLTEIVQAGFNARFRALRVPGPLVKYKVAIVPHRADPGGVRAPVRPDRAQEEAGQRPLRAGRKQIMRPAPRHDRISVPVKIRDLTRMPISHSCPSGRGSIQARARGRPPRATALLVIRRSTHAEVIGPDAHPYHDHAEHSGPR